jgi:hypothetical protein
LATTQLVVRHQADHHEPQVHFAQLQALLPPICV